MFNEHSFNPEAIAVLRSVFDAAWAELEPQTHSGNHASVREALIDALITLGKLGQLDAEQLRPYAVHHAFRAMSHAPRLTRPANKRT